MTWILRDTMIKLPVRDQFLLWALSSATCLKSTVELKTVFHKLYHYLTFSQTSNFRLFKAQEFAGDGFRFDENGRKFFQQVENTVRREIARNKQFLLFSVFSKDLNCRHVKTRACFGKG